MLRSSRLVLGAALILTGLGARAHAQFFGYNAYPYANGGWWGWNGDIQGDVARGLGVYAMGEGELNRETAVANRIDAGTIQSWNQYMYLSQLEAGRRARMRMDMKMKRDAQAGDLAYQRLKENPTPDDISNGAALNVVLDQITDPRIHTSALRLATTPLSGDVIRRIPFTNASEAVTISLAQLTTKDGWPLPLQAERFAAERSAYQAAVNRALHEDEEGDLSPQTIQAVRDAAQRLRAKLAAAPPASAQERIVAQNYVNGLVAMSRMLDKPQVDKVLAELDTIKKTTLGNLLGFMHSFNLRFGPATTPEQRAVYAQLYPMLVAQRDRIMKDAGLADNPPPKPQKDRPTDFFQGIHLDGSPAGNNAAPPNR